MFDDVEVKAYGETHYLKDLATASLQGTNTILVKVFDDTVREEVLKSLNRLDMDKNVIMEGKEIKVKLGTSRKELIAAGLKKVKEANEEYKRNIRDARHKNMEVLKKLSKIVDQDTIKQLENDFDAKIKKAEEVAKKTAEAKEKDLNQP